MFGSKEGVKSIINVLLNGLMQGRLEVRIDSAVCFSYLFDFSKLDILKTEIVKISGALIRNASDKFDSEFKIEIFKTIKKI
jgi:hypothetical protein